MGEQQKVKQVEQDLNHVLKVRREKLAELRRLGRTRFQITKYDVTATAWTSRSIMSSGREGSSHCRPYDVQTRHG